MQYSGVVAAGWFSRVGRPKSKEGVMSEGGEEVEGIFEDNPLGQEIPGTEDPGLETTEDYDDQR
jgi:hypothetical protein